MLLVLDNVEQLHDAIDLLPLLLHHAPQLRLLATSRMPLQLQEEWLFPLSGLAYPLADGENSAEVPVESFGAGQLFVVRARQVRPDLNPVQERHAIQRICALVEGMPLALELAAAWARSLDCAAIAEEIARNKQFLTSPLRNVPQRHRSMQAVFAPTWEQLSAAEKAAFAQMAVFEGSFSREAAEAVAGASVSLLAALVNRSLLQWQGENRYKMHALLRQQAALQLAKLAQDEAAVQARHAHFYLTFLAERSDELLGGGQLAAAAEVVAEWDNVRRAWQWGIDSQGVADLGRGVEALAMVCHIKSRYHDGATLFAAALDSLAFDSAEFQPARVLLLTELGWVAIRLGQLERATELFATARDLYKRHGWQPLPGQGTDPLLGLSTLASIGGRYDEAESLAEAARHTAEIHHHDHNLQTACYQLASVAFAQGDYPRARAMADTARRTCERTADRWFMAYCLSELGRVARAQGQWAQAKQHFEGSYALREAFGDAEGMALALTNLGDVALRQRQWPSAETQFRRSAALYRRIHDRGGLASAHLGLGEAALGQGTLSQAQTELQRALSISAEIAFLPLLLRVLVAIAAFLRATRRDDDATLLLNAVVAHSAADRETHSRAQAQLASAEQVATPAWETVLATAHAALDAPLPETTVQGGLIEPLTERELEVLRLIADGLTNRQIAEALTVVEGTVKAHNHHIFGKLGVDNRVQATLRARELGLV